MVYDTRRVVVVQRYKQAIDNGIQLLLLPRTQTQAHVVVEAHNVSSNTAETASSVSICSSPPPLLSDWLGGSAKLVWLAGCLPGGGGVGCFGHGVHVTGGVLIGRLCDLLIAPASVTALFLFWRGELTCFVPRSCTSQRRCVSLGVGYSEVKSFLCIATEWNDSR